SAYRPSFLKAVDHALALTVEQRPQSVAAWRGALLAPEPEKPGWFSRTQPKHRREPAEAIAAPAAAVSTLPVPPPPDAPAPQGSRLDFLERLKKPASKPASKAASKPVAAPVAAAPQPAPVEAKPVAAPAAAAETVKLNPPKSIKLPKILKKK